MHGFAESLVKIWYENVETSESFLNLKFVKGFNI